MRGGRVRLLPRGGERVSRGWMQTYSGRQFWPFLPKTEDICIEDVAHGLAMTCRYGGHTRRFYSVAEHCWHLSQFAGLEALLHDSSEAYLGDVPRPIKYQPQMAEFRAAEAIIESCVRERFHLSSDPVVWAQVKKLDDRILVDEIMQLMRRPELYLQPGGDGEEGTLAHLQPLGITLQCWGPAAAEENFLLRFYELFPDYEG